MFSIFTFLFGIALFLFGSICSLIYLSNVSYGWVTGEVRTFLKEGSDTSKNFCIGVSAKFRVIWVPENLLGDSLAAQGFKKEKENEFSFSFLNPWAMVFPSFTRGIPKMTTYGSTWPWAKGLRERHGESREASRKVFCGAFFQKSDLSAPQRPLCPQAPS